MNVLKKWRARQERRLLVRFGLLGFGIRAEFRSVQDAVDQMKQHIVELETECDRLRQVLTPEQIREAYRDSLWVVTGG